MASITVGIYAERTEFLAQSITSVLGQSFTKLELLVSDNSDNGSVSDIVRRFKDPRVRLLEGPKSGKPDGWRHIWKNTRTDILNLLGENDILFPTALAELWRTLGNNNRNVFSFSRRTIIDRFGRPLRKPIGFAGKDTVWFEPTALAENIIGGLSNPIVDMSTVLLRRSAFVDSSCLTHYCGLRFQRLNDVAFIFNAAHLGRVSANSNYLVGVRETPDDTQRQRRDPLLPARIFEWEIAIRGAAQTGLLPPGTVAAALPALRSLYEKGSGLAEIRRLAPKLDALEKLLLNDVRAAVTPEFKDDLAFANDCLEQRKQLARAAPALASLPVQEQAESSPAKLSGGIDYLSRTHARGWVLTLEPTKASIWVEANIDGRVVGRAQAELKVGASGPHAQHTYSFDLQFYDPVNGGITPTFEVHTAEMEALSNPLTLPAEDEAFPRREGAQIVLREHAKFTSPGPDYEDLDRPQSTMPADVRGSEPLVVAFYLPQFHTIPENDQFWGAGFTEWRQLARGGSRFPGHYQPRIPRDLGFYDLSDPEVLRRQSHYAQAAGIEAFAYYYYWFNRKRVLEKPLEILLESDIQMPFLIIWANENWTRTWDGSEKEVLLKQDYEPEHEDDLLADLARHMLDPRYVRLQGRPLFVIYNPGHIPEISRTIARWRDIWKIRFDIEPLIFMAQTFAVEDPRQFDLDGAMEFPPHKLGSLVPYGGQAYTFTSDYTGHLLNYDAVAEVSLTLPDPPYPLIKTILPSWDNDARRPNRGMTIHGSTPTKYQAWLRSLVERAVERPIYGRPIVAINAWNEWAEGAYLEPDVHFGSAYLNATARALRQVRLASSSVSSAEQTVTRAAPLIQRRIYLHIGMHKTGTTSIQGALTELRGVLPSHGFLYPNTGCPEHANLGHHLLPWSVFEPGHKIPLVHGEASSFDKAQREGLWAELRDEIDASGADRIILSSEEFDGLHQSEIAEIGRHLSAYEVVPVIFVRRTSALLESNYRTAVLYSDYAQDIRQYVRDSPTRTDIHALLQDWRSITADGEVIVVPYDLSAIKRDAVGAFLLAVGLDSLALSTSASRQLNISVPAFICEIVRGMRNEGVDHTEIATYLRRMSSVRLLRSAVHRYTCMPSDLEQELDAEYQRQITKIQLDPDYPCLRFGIPPTSFSPSRAKLVVGATSANLILAAELGARATSPN